MDDDDDDDRDSEKPWMLKWQRGPGCTCLPYRDQQWTRLVVDPHCPLHGKHL